MNSFAGFPAGLTEGLQAYLQVCLRTESSVIFLDFQESVKIDDRNLNLLICLRNVNSEKREHMKLYLKCDFDLRINSSRRM